MRLKLKIGLLIFPIILVQVAALIAPSFILYQENFVTQIKQRISDSIEQIQSTLDHQLQTLEAESLLFSQSNAINKYLQVKDKNIRFNTMYPVVLAEFSAWQQSHPEYLEISLLTAGGYEEVSLFNKNIKNLTRQEYNTPYFKRIAASSADFEIIPTINPDTNQWALVLARKIFQKNAAKIASSAKKKVNGYIILKTDFDFINKQIKHNSLFNNGFILLNSSDGQPIIAKGDETQIRNNIVDRFSSNLPDKLAINDWSVDKKGYVIGQKKLLENLFCYIGWSKSELNNLLKNISTKSIQISLLMLTLSILLLFFGLNRLLITPILKLNNSAQKMGKKTGEWSFSSNSKDEINDLANTIQEMGKGLIKQKEKVRKIAYIDPLTQLPNRRQFNEDLKQLYKNRQDRLSDIALLFIDLDGFKQVNDSCGHGVGDQLLVIAAKRLQNVLRAQNRLHYADNSEALSQYRIARLGGDEFTILLQNIKGRKAAEQIARRVIHVLNTEISIAGKGFLIGASVGIAIADECGETPVDLLKNADTAMYEAKKKGKNTFRFFNRSSALKSLKAMQIKNELRKAISNNELYLAYQPQICMKTGEIIGCEALIRWYQPSKGWIPPDLFIPIAEESDLILTLGRWVLNEACQHIKQWKAMGDPSVPVWINISCIQLEREDIYQLIMNSLTQAGLAPESLAVEVTESSIMQGSNSIIQLQKLQSAGVHVALDDFGTGYSSLGALRGLPIDKLKIDKVFIDDLKTGENGKKMVNTIINMAHQLDLEVVAEGVEDIEELDFLQRNKADIVQGYYFSRPLLVDDFTESLRVAMRNMTMSL